MRGIAATLNSSATALLSAALRLADIGEKEEARRLIFLAKNIYGAEDQVRQHTKDVCAGRILKVSIH